MNIRNLTSSILLLFSIYVNAQTLQFVNGMYVDYNRNVYTGIYEENYENGNKKLEMHLYEGLQDSITILWFENGKVNEYRNYLKGKMNGKWETYNEQGIKIAEANYVNNIKHGNWKIWNNQAVLLYEMNYNNGKKEGLWKIYNEKGELVNQRQY